MRLSRGQPHPERRADIHAVTDQLGLAYRLGLADADAHRHVIAIPD
jgi:hypothetical protein